MSNKVYFISDLHIGHERVLEFEALLRPFADLSEMHEHMVDKWNSTVRTKDTVWVLGDVLFKRSNADNEKVLSRLNGTKRLVMGNHDTYPTDFYLKYFNKVYGAVKYKDAILTHIPVHSQQLESRYKYNIHGHLHGDHVQDERYMNVSCEVINFTPRTYDELLEM